MTGLFQSLRGRSDVMPFLPMRCDEDSSESIHIPSTPPSSCIRGTPTSPPILIRRAQKEEPLNSSRRSCARRAFFCGVSHAPKNEFFLATPSEIERERNPVPLTAGHFTPVVTGEDGASPKRLKLEKEEDATKEESPCGLADLKQEQPYRTWSDSASANRVLFAPIKQDHSDDDYHMMHYGSPHMPLEPRSRANKLWFVN